MLYRVTSSVGSLVVRLGRRILRQALRSSNLALVTLPTIEELELFKNAFSARQTLLKNSFCVADGVKLGLEQFRNALVQNDFYNG